MIEKAQVFPLRRLIPVVVVGGVATGVGAYTCERARLAPPYLPSPVIESVRWDFEHISREALGSDLWPITWAEDDNLYTAWGDGVGFGARDFKEQWGPDRASFGVSRVEGDPRSYRAINVWGGKNPESSQPATTGKSNGAIIDIGGTLYVFVQEQDVWTRSKLWKSTDHGLTWTDLGWVLDEPDGRFAAPALIQFGKGYTSSRDNYVYGYGALRGHEKANTSLGLFRVLKNHIENRASYEFVSGLGSNGVPTWSSDIRKASAAFTNANSVRWGFNAMYHPPTRRYLLTARHNDESGWGIYDAPEPWGPWTTVAFYADNWLDSTIKFTFVFNQKWMSKDGKHMWMVFSGGGVYDSFNLIKGTFTLKPSEQHAS